MRLTLRTLLAYLDDTLEPQDAEALKAKLVESGFATQLVQRIRDVLERGDLVSPSPLAKSPVEEANVISEFLDSTLPTEQVAEIERACLDSDPQLAEAAACHQILTMVLGRPAEVSDELRQRVYDLPDRKVEDIASGSFSALSIPEEGAGFDSLSQAVPTQEVPPPPSSQTVKPVGVGDSGVSDAPTRLRQIESVEHAEKSPAMAGDKPRSLDDTRIYGGSIRPSRIAPWLGSLALAALLLFALTRIFQPLLNPKPVAESDDVSETINATTDSSESSSGAASSESSSNADASDSPETTPGDDVPGNNASDDVTAAEQDVAPAKASPEGTPSEPSNGESVSPAATETDVSEPVASNVATSDAGDSQTGASQTGASGTPVAADVVAPAPSPPMPPDAGDPATSDNGASPEPPPAQDVAVPGKQAIAKMLTDNTLVAALVGDQWVRLKKNMDIVAGVELVVAPTFRAVMATDEIEVTVVGPSQGRWAKTESGAVAFALERGHMLVTALKPDVKLATDLGGESVELTFADIESVAGIEVTQSREPGFDPLKPVNHIPEIDVISVQGNVTLDAGGKQQTLGTGERWMVRGADAPVVDTPASTPKWVSEPDEGQRTLESTAREGLLELLKTEPSLEIGLRESTQFRRSEVAALAAQTLLSMGRADVYFGGSGILSEPKQRAYWPDHFAMLLAMVDQSPAAAAEVQQSIIKMDSANATSLFRLLMGYSNKQLESGGDTELIENLDSSSMAVRVLALENLHRITGTTLYFRAEQENAVRRAPVIKKWETRQRKGDIRWQDDAPMGP